MTGNSPASTRPRATVAGTQTDTVQALDRGLRLLRLLAKHEQGALLTDLAKELTLPASTAHRLLATLQQAGFAELDEDTGLWRVGVETVPVGSAYLRGRDLVSLARPLMRQLTDASGETSNLAIRRKAFAVYLSQVESRAMVRAFSRIGDRVPLTCSGVGLALLSRASESELDALIAEAGLPVKTEKSIRSRYQLDRALIEARHNGYVIDDEAQVPGMRCVAAPFFDTWGEVAAAISISGPSSRLTAERLPELGRLVADTAARITERLGGKTLPPES
ncbi:IclR family transcriptional regulator [Methylonatrum kenyense]|uniref:IclR family transcriptional regulator n=1 Tax=Methylonatrum kenyense TaxID=455253 RepID=UPI0020C070AC|nr:IclR family transcriptional regulator [Methylonatrum kenyense]MCK8514760.1 IclR family transcriptional regulator [Methylonatrum kenyense]